MIVIEPKKKSKLDLIFPIIGLALILFLSLHIAISYDKVSHNNVIKQGDKANSNKIDPVALITDIQDRLMNHTTEIIIVKSTKKAVGIGCILFLIILASAYTNKKKLITGKEYGTADWAKVQEIAHLFAENIQKKLIRKIYIRYILFKNLRVKEIDKVLNQYHNADMILTDTEHICMYNYELNNNTLIIGGAGSGKTRGYVLPNILQGHSSFGVTDPKGEIIEKIGNFLVNVMGYKLRVLNLWQKELCDHYNPFVYIHRERNNWEENVLSLIETIIINTDGGEKHKSSDPFWDKAERLFLQGVFFAVVEAFPAEQANINTAMELIKMLKIGEEEDSMDSDLDLFFKCFKQKYGDDHIAVLQFEEFREKASGKTAKSIVISTVARLAPFRLKELRRIFSKDDMHLDRIGEEKTAIFVILPPVDKTFNFIAGILFTQLFQELNYCALTVHKKDGQRLPVPCRFILDEFANTCTIPNFISILSYARSLGIGITLILQSLDQIKAMYKDDWGVIIDNCDTMLYLGKVKTKDTLEYLSSLLGKGTFHKQSRSRTRGARQSSNSTSTDSIGRDLLDFSEVRKLPSDKCLLFVSGKNPFYSVKYDYKNHENYKYTSDFDKQYSFEYEPYGVVEAKNKLPHGEDKQSSDSSIKDIREIKFNVDQEQVIKMLSERLLNVDFDKDEILQLSDGEIEDLELYNQLLTEAESAVQEYNNISKLVVERAKIEVNTSIEAITESVGFLMNDILKEEGQEIVDFDNIPTVKEGELEDEFELDDETVVLVNSFDHLIEGANDLKENMGDFLNEINNLDLSQLQSADDNSATA